MANADAPFGFRPIRNDGAPYSGQTERVVFTTTATTVAFVGDAVSLAVTAADATGDPAVELATAGGDVFGVVTSLEANPDNLSQVSRPTVTKRFSQVCMADNALFEVKASTNPGLALVGSNIAYLYGVGSTVTGISGSEIANPSSVTGEDLQIVRGVNRPDNDLTASNSVWVVKFNLPRGRPTAPGLAT